MAFFLLFDEIRAGYNLVKRCMCTRDTFIFHVFYFLFGGGDITKHAEGAAQRGTAVKVGKKKRLSQKKFQLWGVGGIVSERSPP